ncbi:MAG: LysR family transcriptional regulator [Pseudomonadota bacterium]
MELRQIRHFVEIVDCASFGQAAEKLYLTQPALSKSIKNLEEHLKVRLLERYPSGVVPTEYGRVFYDYATMVNFELDRAVQEIEQMRGTGKGMVRVGVGTTLLKYLMPEATRQFLAHGESDTVHVRQGLKDALMPMLRRGELDIIVTSVPPTLNDPDLRQEIILEDSITVVADHAHPLVNRSRLTLADLKAHKWVLPDTTEREGDRLAHAFRDAGLPAPRLAIRTGSSSFMASMLRDSDLLSYLPTALIALDGDYAHLRALPVDTIWSKVLVGVTYRKRGVMLQSTRRFINRLKDAGSEVTRRLQDHVSSAA